jgi:hypothetical protein
MILPAVLGVTTPLTRANATPPRLPDCTLAVEYLKHGMVHPWRFVAP